MWSIITSTFYYLEIMCLIICNYNLYILCIIFYCKIVFSICYLWLRKYKRFRYYYLLGDVIMWIFSTFSNKICLKTIIVNCWINISQLFTTKLAIISNKAYILKCRYKVHICEIHCDYKGNLILRHIYYNMFRNNKYKLFI